VFASFLAATLACAKLSFGDGKHLSGCINAMGAALVTMVLALNLTRLDGVIALIVSGAIALLLWRTWVGRGRPRGALHAAAKGEPTP
jgi:hypothetical protein